MRRFCPALTSLLLAAPYILGMLLCGEFDAPSVQLNKSLIPIDIDEAKWRVERSAYLCFGPAQYKMVCSFRAAFDPYPGADEVVCRGTLTSTRLSDACSTRSCPCSITLSVSLASCAPPNGLMLTGYSQLRKMARSRPTWVRLPRSSLDG